MPLACWSNYLLDQRAGTLQSYLNGLGANLRLFSNVLVPTPASLLTDFVECNFPGYAAIPLNGLFGAPAFVIDGEWQIATGTLSFTCTGGPGQFVQGWWIDDGTNLIAAQNFSPAEFVGPGSPLQFSLRPQEISQSIL